MFAMKWRWRIGLLLVVAVLAIGGGVGVTLWRAHHVPALCKEDLAGLDLSHADNLMIVAHPDDETLWGGGHLIEGDYLVVCLTNAKNSTRSAEFQKAMEVSGDSYLMLSYPDKVLGKRDSWKQVEDDIAADLKLLLSAKKWDRIVTHNPEGEYGHQHHIRTSALVTQEYKALGLSCPLSYFGAYYSKAKIDAVSGGWKKLSEPTLSRKAEMLVAYDSQERVVKGFAHITDYENWTDAN